MMLRRAVLSLLLVLPAAGQHPDDFARAEEALAARLWEVAAARFSERLDDPELPTQQRQLATIRMIEAWIRGDQPQRALELLAASSLSDHPEAYFWKGQALAGTGRFMEAVETLEAAFAEPAPPFRREAAFTRANLQLSLNQPDAALETLQRLAAASGAATTAEARLREVEILLDQGRTPEAREKLPNFEAIAVASRPHARFLDARLSLAEGDANRAAAGFAALLDQPRGQTLLRHHAAAVGLADALAAQGSLRGASDSLLDFVIRHPDSPLLEPIFKRLIHWLPDAPSATDPLIVRLAPWTTSLSAPRPELLGGGSEGAAAVWPTRSESADLRAFALFARGLALQRLGTAEAQDEARLLLTRLRLEQPDHFLASQALLEWGRWLLDAGETARALIVLDAVRDTARSPVLRGVASFAEGRAAYLEGEETRAAELFDLAAEALESPGRDHSRFNAALARLAEGEIVTIQAEGDPQRTASLQTDLELEQALAATPPSAAMAALDAFLTRHPDHPRAPEARLAAVEAALAATPPDRSMARAQLDTLQASEATTSLPPERLALSRLRLIDLEGEATATIAAARALLEEFPAGPAAAEAAFILGRNLFQSGSYNDARIELERLATVAEEPARAQAAWLLAARAADLVPTVRSREEALDLFQRAIDTDGPLAPLARILKARLMIDLGRMTEAAAFIREWLAPLPPDDPLRVPGGQLLAEAVAKSGSEPEAQEASLAIYDSLLEHPDIEPADRQRLQYLRGRILETLPRPENPNLTHEAEALEAYYSVLENASHPPAEWEYFNLAGLRALTLLENAQRWKAAISVAEKLASFGGPQAQDAADRAQALRLKHMIWEE